MHLAKPVFLMLWSYMGSYTCDWNQQSYNCWTPSLPDCHNTTPCDLKSYFCSTQNFVSDNNF